MPQRCYDTIGQADRSNVRERGAVRIPAFQYNPTVHPEPTSCINWRCVPCTMTGCSVVHYATEQAMKGARKKAHQDGVARDFRVGHEVPEVHALAGEVLLIAEMEKHGVRERRQRSLGHGHVGDRLSAWLVRAPCM